MVKRVAFAERPENDKKLVALENRGLCTKWDSFTLRKYKVNLIRTLTFRCFRISS